MQEPHDTSVYISWLLTDYYAFKEVKNTKASYKKDKGSNPRNKHWPYTNCKLQFCFSLAWWFIIPKPKICIGDVDRQRLSVWFLMNKFCPYCTPTLILDRIGPISTLKWKVCKITPTQMKNTKGKFCHQYKWKPGGIQICVLSILSDTEPINQEHLQGINSHHHRIQ